MRKVLVILLALLLVVTAFAGCAKDEEPGTSTTTTTKGTTASGATTTTAAPTEPALTYPLEEPITITFVCMEHPTVGQMSVVNNPAYDYFVERTGITIEYEQVPIDAFPVRVNLMLGTGELPDLLQNAAPLDLNDANQRKLFVNILEYKELLPNFIDFLKANPDYMEWTADLLSQPGELYGFPNYFPANRYGNMNTLAYRQDLFVKLGLKTDTWENVFESLKTLKQEYPDSYPLGAFDGGALYDTFAKGFHSGFGTSGIYFNIDDQQYHFGPYDASFKEMVAWLAKSNAAGLVHPDAFVATRDMLYEQLTNEEIFLFTMPFQPGAWRWEPMFGDRLAKQYMEGDRIAEFVDGDDGVIVQAFLMPKNSAGQVGWAKFRTGWSNYFVISKSSDYVEQIVGFYDLCYSDPEFTPAMANGPKGQAWDFDANGERKYVSDIKTPYNPEGTKTIAEWWLDKTGATFNSMPYLSSIGVFITDDLLGAELNFDTQDTRKNHAIPFYEDGSGYFGPTPKLLLDADTSETVAQTTTALATYVQETLAQFITGQKSLDDWDSFLAQCATMGADELLQIHNDSFIFFTSDDLMID